ncbi:MULTISPECIES: PDZ domain-containing protein [unclassified Paenibacillus]|uniref:PDZ domain-containing protein n=1 Tax=unclassified Paenibacillus TaxID=185978 RepID=UPI0027D784E2|nr:MULTISPECIES: PDZ domain-containing protein [unclassified Paenibacillus]
MFVAIVNKLIRITAFQVMTRVAVTVFLILITMTILYFVPANDKTIYAVGELSETDSYLDRQGWEKYSGKPFDNNLPPIYATSVYTTNPKNVLSLLCEVLLFQLQGRSPSLKTSTLTAPGLQEDILDQYDTYAEMVLHSLVSAKRELYSFDIEVKPTIQSYDPKLHENKNSFDINDIILSIDGVEVNSLHEYVSLKKTWNLQYGDRHVFTVLREGNKQEIPFTYTEKTGDQFITGISVRDSITDTNHAYLINELFKYDYHTAGNSAGLMHALNLVQRISDRSLTKGYKIAGTGTMELDGKVGPIGSIDLKIKTADREKVDIFFVPKYYPIARWKDITYENSNEKEAIDTAARIHSKMIIVPVETLQGAIDFLSNLPER